MRSIQRQQSNFDQERDHARAKQLLHLGVIAGKKRVCRATLFLSEFASEFSSAHHMRLALAIKQSVRHQRVQVRMKVEIFAEGVDRHDDGWNAIVRRVANAVRVAERITQKVTHALMRDAAELLEQLSVKLHWTGKGQLGTGTFT